MGSLPQGPTVLDITEEAALDMTCACRWTLFSVGLDLNPCLLLQAWVSVPLCGQAPDRQRSGQDLQSCGGLMGKLDVADLSGSNRCLGQAWGGQERSKRGNEPGCDRRSCPQWEDGSEGRQPGPVPTWACTQRDSFSQNGALCSGPQ